MSKRLSNKTKRPSASRGLLSAIDESQPNGTQVPDTVEKRRMQNRLAQRNHRRKVRDHINALEARVIKSMLQRPSPYGVPLSASNFTEVPEQSYTQLFQTPETNFDFNVEFSDTINQIYSLPSGAQSPGTLSLPSDGPASPLHIFEEYATPSTSCLSLPLDSRSSSVSGPRASGVTFDLITSFPDPQVDPLLLCQMETSLSLMDNSNYHKLRANSMPESQNEFTMRLFSNSSPSSPKIRNQRGSHNTEPVLMRHFQPHSHQPCPTEPHSWIPETLPTHEKCAISSTLPNFSQNRRPPVEFTEEFPMHQTNPYMSPDFLNTAPTRQQHVTTPAPTQYASLHTSQKSPFEQMSIYRSPTYF